MKKLLLTLIIILGTTTFALTPDLHAYELSIFDRSFGTKENDEYIRKASRLLKGISIWVDEEPRQIVEDTEKCVKIIKEEHGKGIKGIDLLEWVYNDLKKGRNKDDKTYRELVEYYSYYMKGYYSGDM